MSTDLINDLAAVLAERRGGDPNTSYVASLHAAGLNKILEKVSEEATETLLAARDLHDPSVLAKQSSDQLSAALANEVADLWFHSMVLLSECDIHPQQILDILSDRFGVSGIEEKRNR